MQWFEVLNQSKIDWQRERELLESSLEWMEWTINVTIVVRYWSQSSESTKVTICLPLYRAQIPCSLVELSLPAQLLWRLQYKWRVDQSPVCGVCLGGPIGLCRINVPYYDRGAKVAPKWSLPCSFLSRSFNHTLSFPLALFLVMLLGVYVNRAEECRL